MGYGDIVPITYIGWCVGSLTAIIGVLILVMPIKLVAYNF